MLTLSELKEWFDDISSILIDMNIALHNLEELLNFSDDFQIQKVKSIGFFAHHKFQLHFILVIQLAKLFSNSKQQKRRIINLLTKLKTLEYDSELIEQFETNKQVQTFWINNEEVPKVFKNKDSILTEIELFISRLNSSSTIIKKIEDARNKVYAHTDPGKEQPIPFVAISELNEMVTLANDFYNIFHGRLFDVDTDFSTPDWNVKYILKKIVKSYPIQN